MDRIGKINHLLIQLLAFSGGFTFSSICITKSNNWYFSLPIFSIVLVILIINLVKNKK